jgi:lysophospholipase L1-like esterase
MRILHRSLILMAMLMAAPLLPATATAADKFFVHNGDRVVFLGDSITEQRLYTTYLEAYTLSRYPKWELSFRNVGWGGDTSWLRQRAHPDEGKLFAANPEDQQKMVEQAVAAGLERDVLPLKPTAITIKFGMNDHSYQVFREDIFRAYVRSQSQLAKVLEANGARVAFLTPQPIEDKRPDPDKEIKNLSLRKFSDGLKQVAVEKHALFVDQFDPYLALMMTARAENPNAIIGGGDAVHPGPPGHTIMAWAILKGLGASALVSTAEVKVKNRKAKVGSVKQCKIAKLKAEGDGISFDRIDASLPMPIDSRALPALKLAPILGDLSRYELKVTGLTAAKYDVTIDGESAGTVTKEELAAGWNMTTADGPIAKQNAELLKLVFEKNNVFFDRWRNVQLNPNRQSELPALDRKIADLETRINEVRQPKPHHFELKPAM